MKTAHPSPPLPDRIASLREAAAIRGVSIDTLRRMGARGEIEILQLSPRRRGVRLSNVIPSAPNPQREHVRSQNKSRHPGVARGDGESRS